MRWVKHLTSSRQDEKLARLIAAHGLAAYGLWWAVVEVVAERVERDSQPTVTYPVSVWSHRLSLRGSHIRSAMAKLVVSGLVTTEWNRSELTVTIPNLLKYRDEYSRKSGHAPDIVRTINTEADTDIEADTETDKKTSKKNEPESEVCPNDAGIWKPEKCSEFLLALGWRAKKSGWDIPEKQSAAILDLEAGSLEEGCELETIRSLLIQFDLWWDEYWRKVSKQQAREAWFKATWQFVWEEKSWDLVEQIQTASALQKPAMMKRDASARPHGATWLNNSRWSDEIEEANGVGIFSSSQAVRKFGTSSDPAANPI